MIRPALILCLALGCGPARNALLAVTPTVPPPAGSACPAVPWRCEGNVPEHCVAADGVARWFPVTPLADDNRPARCRVCVVEATAHFAREIDAGPPAV